MNFNQPDIPNHVTPNRNNHLNSGNEGRSFNDRHSNLFNSGSSNSNGPDFNTRPLRPFNNGQPDAFSGNNHGGSSPGRRPNEINGNQVFAGNASEWTYGFKVY